MAVWVPRRLKEDASQRKKKQKDLSFVSSHSWQVWKYFFYRMKKCNTTKIRFVWVETYSQYFRKYLTITTIMTTATTATTTHTHHKYLKTVAAPWGGTCLSIIGCAAPPNLRKAVIFGSFIRCHARFAARRRHADGYLMFTAAGVTTNQWVPFAAEPCAGWLAAWPRPTGTWQASPPAAHRKMHFFDISQRG